GGTSGDTTSGDTTSGDTTSGDTTSGDTSAAGSSASGTDDTGGVDLVVFTRAGWANPAGIQRSTLERVSYRFNDGKLWRMHWEVLDDVEGSQPVHRELLDHVKSVSFRFMNDSRQWVTQWPATGNSAMRTRPFAVEVTLELTDWGRIVRVIEVPA
ncbi:MAG TPA: type II secretion system minor pseudopilin GspJ, partial [Steroidobacteraceae bacterium]|nr:type II secretion system minor pseudopilin GspJ [Steroidobacteraceae bacterium]